MGLDNLRQRHYHLSVPILRRAMYAPHGLCSAHRRPDMASGSAEHRACQPEHSLQKPIPQCKTDRCRVGSIVHDCSDNNRHYLHLWQQRILSHDRHRRRTNIVSPVIAHRRVVQVVQIVPIAFNLILIRVHRGRAAALDPRSVARPPASTLRFGGGPETDQQHPTDGDLEANYDLPGLGASDGNSDGSTASFSRVEKI
jgi:hypothetical protein